MSRFARLTYCTNVHPGESLTELEAALDRFTLPVKRRVSPHTPFNVGLRLSAQAAHELASEAALERFEQKLAGSGLYVTSLNGFPYGAFHATRVKESVYRPDWHEPQRLSYTLALFRILAALLPEGAAGSVSTVPGCFRARATPHSEAQLAAALHAAVSELVALERTTGKRIVLALEPEPACIVETAAEATAFFERALLARPALSQLARALGTTPLDAEVLVRRHLGVCLDACHASVVHESPLESYRSFRSAGIAVGKVQVSAGLALSSPDADALRELSKYDEPTYLHQTVVRRGDALHRYVDLGDALAHEPAGGEWRVHFHVPVFHGGLGAFGSTQRDLSELLSELDEASAPDLEVETYTWDVLPAELRARPLVDAICEELEWTRARLGGSSHAELPPS